MKKKLILIAIPFSLILTGAIMDNTRKEIWFEGSTEINVGLPKIEKSLDDFGTYFLGVINLMPGMTDVKLIEKGNDFVTIQTNEGIMKRTNISIVVSKEKISIDFDEQYQAGKTITTNSHFRHEFKVGENSVDHNMVISSLKAPGFMGFFYRNFGSKNIGNAFLNSHKQYLES